MSDHGILQTDFDRYGIDDAVKFATPWFEAGFMWGGQWLDPLVHGVTACVNAYRTALGKQGRKIRDGRVDAMHWELQHSPTSFAQVSTLRKGKSGIYVRLWKARLTKLGAQRLAGSDFFGDGTEAATKEFQHNKGLLEDGVVGTKTWGAAW
jgi:peptidoglycan hydrolase-like protein with peptidoglycan-binding domain